MDKRATPPIPDRTSKPNWNKVLPAPENYYNKIGHDEVDEVPIGEYQFVFSNPKPTLQRNRSKDEDCVDTRDGCIAPKSPGLEKQIYNLKKLDLVGPEELSRRKKVSKPKKLVEEVKEENDGFLTAKANLKLAEWDFIEVYSDMMKAATYQEISKENRNKLARIFGRLEELLEFHKKFVDDLDKVYSSSDLYQLIVDREKQFGLHIWDQWKSCQSMTAEVKKQLMIDDKFCTLSQVHVKAFLGELRNIAREEKTEQNPTYRRAFDVLRQVLEQIEYINSGLKQISDPKIDLEVCGRVLVQDMVQVKKDGLFGKTAPRHMFLTEKYLILTKVKDKEYVYQDSLLIKDIRYTSNKETSLVQFTRFVGDGKKSVLGVYVDEKKFDAVIGSIDFLKS